MHEIFKFLDTAGGQGDQLGTWEMVFALVLSLLLSLVISLVYRFTHKGAGYSQSYVHSLVLMGLVTTLIMIVIGSNIARAFSLVGALSIIRFRNAVKETRDVAYIFFAMAVAMACGTRFYLYGGLATGIISAVMIVLHIDNFAVGRRNPERLLLVQLPPNVDVESVLDPVLNKLFDAYSLVSLESVRQGLYVEAVLSVRPKRGLKGSTVLDELAKVNGNLKVSYSYSAHTDEL